LRSDNRRSNKARASASRCLQRVVVSEPETAGKEDAFSGRETVNACLGSVTQHKAIGNQLSLDRRDGATYTGIVGRQETHDRHQQQARIKLAPAEALREGVAAGVESLLADGRVHAVPNLSPALQRSLQVETLRITHRAIKGDPRHDLRMGEMAAPTPYFPDSIVRLLPNPLQILDQLLLLRPGLGDRSEACACATGRWHR